MPPLPQLEKLKSRDVKGIALSHHQEATETNVSISRGLGRAVNHIPWGCGKAGHAQVPPTATVIDSGLGT